jgi:ABC-type multidrug transport system ATPase subunit
MDIEKSTLIGLYGNKMKSFLMLLAGMESFEGDIVLDSISLKGDIEEYLNLIALMTKESIVKTNLSVNDFLDFYGCMSNAFNDDYEDRKDQLLEEFDLLNLKNSSIKKLSMENRTKVKLLSLFLKDHTLILIDTFLESFNKEGRKKVIAFLKKYAKEERIVLVGSEDLQLLQSFSDEIYILN